jgi:ribonuclease R
MSALMEMNPQGDVVGYELVPGIIRSAERMTYTAVRDILNGEPAACHRYAPLVSNFKLMEELALILNRRRELRGSIDFDLPEPLIEFDEFGRMVGITRSERNVAHRLIEEFMLAANETVALHLEHRGVPSLYRIHEKPDAKKVLEFEEIAATFGYSLGVELPAAQRLRMSKRDERDRHPRFLERREAKDLEISPRHYQHLTQRLEGKPEERILSYLMLRSLKQARYSEENVGHFALAAGTYTHFTSPIRRYPDLIVHRILKATLEGEDGGAFVFPQELQALGVATSEAERRAADAERELIEWKKVRFMQERVGDEFAALVLNPAKYGLFVELTELFVEGLVPIDSLRSDRFIWRENTHEIVGERTGRRFRVGDCVQVILDRVLAQERKLQFALVEEELKLTGGARPQPASKSKKQRRREGASPPAKHAGRRRKKARRR